MYAICPISRRTETSPSVTKHTRALSGTWPQMARALDQAITFRCWKQSRWRMIKTTKISYILWRIALKPSYRIWRKCSQPSFTEKKWTEESSPRWCRPSRTCQPRWELSLIRTSDSSKNCSNRTFHGLNSSFRLLVPKWTNSLILSGLFRIRRSSSTPTLKILIVSHKTREQARLSPLRMRRSIQKMHRSCSSKIK